MKQHLITAAGVCLSIILCLCAVSAFAQEGIPITAGNASHLEAVGSFGETGTFASNTSIAYGADNQTLAVCGARGIELWDTGTGAARLLVDTPCDALAFSPDGALIAAADLREVSLYDAANGTKIAAYPGRAFAFSPDGQQLAIITDDGTVTIYAAPPGSDAASLPPPATAIPAEPTVVPAANATPTSAFLQPTAASIAVCTLTAQGNINLHSGPSLNDERTGLVVNGNTMIADGRTQGADRMTWYHLDSNEWVRADLVAEPPECNNLATISP